MRPAIYVAAVVALAAVFPQALRSIAASAASVLIEAAPFVLGSAALARLLPMGRRVAAYLGCGCDGGPSARSAPAALLTALAFGPAVALARVVAALAVARLFPRHVHADAEPLGDIVRLVPSALLAGTVSTFAPALDLAHRGIACQLGAGAVLGFVVSPCALGGVALAMALRSQSGLASNAVLCVAGIADLNVWLPRPCSERGDRFAYLGIAAACAIVAVEHGAMLVHPRWSIALAAASVLAAAFAMRARHVYTLARIVAASLVLTTVIGAPAPAVTLTETTLAGAFPGARIDFTGAVMRAHGATSLVRYAITCCRADARPIVLRIDAAHVAATWVRARGIVALHDESLILEPERITPIAPPSDPFVYE
jgi:hypothetical protein